MNRTAAPIILTVILSCATVSLSARAQGAPPRAGDSDKTANALIARDKAVAALAEANATLEEEYAQWVLKRFPGIANIDTIRKTYRLEPRFRKAFIDIERLERLRDHPETRGNEPAGLDIPALIAVHENVLKSTMTPSSPAMRIEPVRSEPGSDVEKFVADLRRNPTTPSEAKDRLAIYMLNVETGEVLLVADEPDPGFTYCGSPEWSVDGNRILFDAIPAPGNRFSESKLKALELIDGKLRLADLGPGNCPTGTPDGSAIVFLLNSGAVAGAEAGVWSMKADGTDRNSLCDYGRPCMSPDGKHLLVSSFGSSKQLTLLDVESGDVKQVPFLGYRIISTPVWVNPTSFVSMIQSEMGEAIALVEIKSPTGLSVESILWKLDANIELYASHPAYSAVTGRCVFVGLSREGRALYSVMKDSDQPPKRLEAGPFDNMLASLAFSPYGKYLLFCGDRPGAIKKKP